MRARIFVFFGAITLSGAAFVVQACSGETDTPATAADSGPDTAVADTAPPKEAAPVETDSATCDLSADFSSSIPDASIADGATTTGACLQCAHASCEGPLSACNTDCTCQTVAGQTLGCFLQNSGKSKLEIYQACGGSLLGLDQNTQNLALAIVTCLDKSCPTECATSAFKPDDAGADADAN